MAMHPGKSRQTHVTIARGTLIWASDIIHEDVRPRSWSNHYLLLASIHYRKSDHFTSYLQVVLNI